MSRDFFLGFLEVNILEEEIDVQVQKEYFALLNKLNKNVNARTQLTQEYIERLNDLFDDTTLKKIFKYIFCFSTKNLMQTKGSIYIRFAP